MKIYTDTERYIEEIYTDTERDILKRYIRIRRDILKKISIVNPTKDVKQETNMRFKKDKNLQIWIKTIYSCAYFKNRFNFIHESGSISVRF